MRQIKFRAWDGRILHYSDNDFGSLEAFFALTDDKGYGAKTIYQQFTGLFDKNGREIYEGDILKIEEWDRDDLIAKVIFCERNVGFRVATGSGVVYENFPSSRYLQVIGNIFENPELLK